MAAMFQAQTANWEETQEKMSQLVSRWRFLSYVVQPRLMNICVFPYFVYLATHSQQRIYSNPRGGGPARGGKPYVSHHADRPLPPSYVCYRCGQKGPHFIECHWSNPLHYSLKGTGFRIVLRTTTGITTTDRASSVRLAFLARS